MTYRTLIAAAALTMGSVNAMATELPIYQASGFPMTAHQATVLTPANMVERLPDSAFIYGSPHQIAVLTPRHSETSQAAAAGGSMQARRPCRPPPPPLPSREPNSMSPSTTAASGSG
jgi:hypothetical protein